MAALNEKIAQSIIDANGLTADKLWKTSDALEGRTVLYFDDTDELWRLVDRKVKSLRPVTLALIIWYANLGPNELYFVHQGAWLSKYDDGRTLLRKIAATTLVATIKQLVPVPALVA